MLIDIGGWMYGFFGPYGGWGVLLCIMLIFLIDALIFPTLPELFFVIGFIYNPTLTFGVELLFAAAIGEVIGISILYLVVENISVPAKIKKVADRYINFLVVSDERILLVNRVAPMIPFAGAFISIVDSWKLSRALMYVVMGCFLKYGVILLMSGFFYAYFSSDAAQTYTIVFVFIVIIVSFIVSMLKKKKKLTENTTD
ncbi:MAG: hypothetical protein WCR83_03035 [Candidatus Methanomethylophilaceae archaeon]